MSEPSDIGVAQLAGRWAIPTIESTADASVRMHVSIQVPNTDDLAEDEVGCVLVAGGQALNLREATPAGQLIYLQTLGTTAVAQFVFDNPDNLSLESVTVTLQGESITWSFGSSSLPVA